VIEDLPAGSIDWAALRAANPALVQMTATGFGSGNAFSHWQWTDGVLHALTTELSRSGIKGHAPLLPPGEIALQCAIAQGTYVAMAALTQALVSGTGGPVDFAALDGAMQALDPPFGISGSATNGRPAASLPRTATQGCAVSDHPGGGRLCPALRARPAPVAGHARDDGLARRVRRTRVQRHHGPLQEPGTARRDAGVPW
jgi:crotonobetainyl-CoA:carnitine CoA-transferase CaiB-like acyl-CoA transferase